MTTIEFFFDLSSPWTRLAFHNIQPIVAETGSDIIWRPFLVGGVFNAVNDSIYRARDGEGARKYEHQMQSLYEWADLAGLPMRFPTEFHPVKSVNIMRCCCVIEEDEETLHQFASSAFHTYFGEGRNIDDIDVIMQIADQCGIDGAEIIARSRSKKIKDRLRANTDEAIDRGAYGSPTMFVAGTRMYFGNDQLPLVRKALQSCS
ncbi:2-hydroxychromene-2-carboxylate isomerase [Henriciella aquimarina]|uniref:2-hydroxychromene-2-carboxylate isomerase n=1 Tax=Henriciella aquimarina TaxID=545261 RepID=UPI0009FD9C2C|nr:2-hydroxychromene-2-carboxylate isomerase [Henriciella aquimarina]